MPSVKDILVDVPPDGGVGRGRFRFTDAYSVFDWGRMPDEIPRKGASLATMGAHSFEVLEDAGVPTHYRGVLPPDADTGIDPRPLAELDAAPTEMAIDLVDVPELPHGDTGYEYDAYHAAAGDAVLVPLEIVFRNVVPVTSSLRKRVEPADVGLHLERWPDESVDLVAPIVEFSTKFEHSDRYVDRQTADAMAGPAPIEELEDIAAAVNRHLTDHAADRGFVHLDGKIECLYVGGEVRVADVAGTFDENRFTFDGVQVSKESLRRYYRRTQPAWVEEIQSAKGAARSADDAEWRSRCTVSPEPLPPALVRAAGDLYAAGTNRYVARDLLPAPDLPTAIEALETAGKVD